jgi:hypothetical protein
MPTSLDLAYHSAMNGDGAPPSGSDDEIDDAEELETGALDPDELDDDPDWFDEGSDDEGSDDDD